tara:strand:+ start:201 stop:404 length:204 start_codon:yes stop_codon:yes gene_type:complete
MNENLIRFPKMEKTKPLRLMTSTQVRELFDISRTTLHRWSNEKQLLPKLKVGRRIYFKREDIEKILK